MYMCAHINDYNCNLYINLIVILCKNIMEKQKYVIRLKSCSYIYIQKKKLEELIYSNFLT